MIEKSNLILDRLHKKPIVWDAYFNASHLKKPLVIFCHGYKGFKDWGAWNMMARAFSESNFFYVKFNFSHNGGTIKQPIDFPDLEAFAENNYSKELEDLDDILNHLTSENNVFNKEINTNQITLIGHSRGGGISIIKAAEDSRITQLITLASVSDFGSRSATYGELDVWKKKGVKFVLNGRTKQQMPHNYQFHEDFITNAQRLNIERATKAIQIPQLIIHGKKDTSINYAEAEAIHSWNEKSILFPIVNTNHVFDAMHPWEELKMPMALSQVVKTAIQFIKEE